MNCINPVYGVIKGLFAGIILLFSMSIFSSNEVDNFNSTEIEEGLYIHFGQHVPIEDKRHDDIANIGFIIGNNCIAVIDTGGSVDIGNRLLDKIRSISKKPICYVINTHIHFDHVLGNQAFVKEYPVFVGHQGLAAAIEQNRTFFLTQFKDNLGIRPDASSIIAPDELIDDTKQIDLGGRVLTLKAYPVSHSHNDLLVVDNKTKTVWVGDLISRERVPSLTGSLVGWIKVMEDLQTLVVRKIIPGHGRVANSIAEAIGQQQTYLKTLLVETRKAIAAGMYANEAMESVAKENHWGWLLYQSRHPANIAKAFNELEWE